MRPAIEHPVASIGPQNKHVLDTLTIAYRCAMGLAERGYVVIEVLTRNHKPIVWVQPCKQLESLHGREYKWNRFESTMQADVDGCRVQWKVMH